jgi:hypothetical protein
VNDGSFGCAFHFHCQILHIFWNKRRYMNVCNGFSLLK